MIRVSSLPALFFAVLVLGAGVLYWLWQPLSPKIAMADLKGDVARGAYLARMSGCIACHTDTESGGVALAGGKAIYTPFGEFRAPNLSTDGEHGIGAWTLQEFSAAVREGISPEGKPYYPAFPYTFFTRFSDQDIADLWAAFQTVPAISEPDPEQDINFPFSIRQGLNLWRALFFDYAVEQGRPEQERVERERVEQERTEYSKAPAMDRYERGQYIVEVAAHCGACHTPRNLFGALIWEEAYAGGVDAAGKAVPNITAQRLKAEGWTADDLAYALQTGIKADGDVFGGSMSEVVEHGMAYLQWQDLNAIAHYLLQRPDKPQTD